MMMRKKMLRMKMKLCCCCCSWRCSCRRKIKLKLQGVQQSNSAKNRVESCQGEMKVVGERDWPSSEITVKCDWCFFSCFYFLLFASTAALATADWLSYSDNSVNHAATTQCDSEMYFYNGRSNCKVTCRYKRENHWTDRGVRCRWSEDAF